MPYKSAAQRGYFHAAMSRGEMKPSVVHEFDESSRGEHDLPEHVKAAHGGAVCMACGGTGIMDEDGDFDGTTEQDMQLEEQREKAMRPSFREAMWRGGY